jgi:hypothetical protein
VVGCGGGGGAVEGGGRRSGAFPDQQKTLPCKRSIARRCITAPEQDTIPPPSAPATHAPTTDRPCRPPSAISRPPIERGHAARDPPSIAPPHRQPAHPPPTTRAAHLLPSPARPSAAARGPRPAFYRPPAGHSHRPPRIGVRGGRKGHERASITLGAEMNEASAAFFRICRPPSTDRPCRPPSTDHPPGHRSPPSTSAPATHLPTTDHPDMAMRTGSSFCGKGQRKESILGRSETRLLSDGDAGSGPAAHLVPSPARPSTAAP